MDDNCNGCYKSNNCPSLAHFSQTFYVCGSLCKRERRIPEDANSTITARSNPNSCSRWSNRNKRLSHDDYWELDDIDTLEPFVLQVSRHATLAMISQSLWRSELELECEHLNSKTETIILDASLDAIGADIHDKNVRLATLVVHPQPAFYAPEAKTPWFRKVCVSIMLCLIK